MERNVAVMLVGALMVLVAGAGPAAEKAAPAKPESAKAAKAGPAKAVKEAAPRAAEEPDDGIHGLYAGKVGGANTEMPWPIVAASAQVISQGGGAYRVNLMDGGRKKAELAGKLEGGKVALSGPGGEKGAIENGKLTAEAAGAKFVLARTAPRSPAELQKPPPGAVVLLPYEPGKAPSLDEWTNGAWQASADGSMTVAKGDNLTKRQFGDFQLHLEFRLPFEPQGKGQGRGNSGVYIFGLYEIQILDSFGVEPEVHQCGAVYTQTPPRQNACFPPGCWQTYDITFRAPRFDADGKKAADAAVTVVQNGVTVQDKTPVRGPTGAARGKPEVKSGQIRLQDHQHPVKYRNVWIKELKD